MRSASSLLSTASLLWRISTIAILLGSLALRAAETPLLDHPSAKTSASGSTPFFTDQEWDKSTSQPASGNSFDSTPAITGVIVSLVLVAGLAVGLGMLVKRFGLRRIMPGKGRHLEVVEHLAIGYKRTVSLVRIGDQVLVLGQGEHDLNHLATLPASILDQVRPVAAASVLAHINTPAAVPGAAGAFRNALDKALGRAP